MNRVARDTGSKYRANNCGTYFAYCATTCKDCANWVGSKAVCEVLHVCGVVELGDVVDFKFLKRMWYMDRPSNPVEKFSEISGSKMSYLSLHPKVLEAELQKFSRPKFEPESLFIGQNSDQYKPCSQLKAQNFEGLSTAGDTQALTKRA